MHSLIQDFILPFLQKNKIQTIVHSISHLKNCQHPHPSSNTFNLLQDINQFFIKVDLLA